MIPLRDVVPSRTQPVVTLALIALSTAAFAFDLPARETLDSNGSLALPALARFASSTLGHANLLHLAGNLLYLWLFAATVEDRMGHRRFALFYMACGAGAALTEALVRPGTPVAGASGAVAGVLGAYFLLYPRSKILTLVPLVLAIPFVEVPAVFFLAFWVMLQFITTFEAAGTAPAISNVAAAFWTHAAAFLMGAVGVVVLRRPERLRVDWWDDV